MISSGFRHEFKLVGQLVAAGLLIALGTYVQIIPAQFLGLPGQTNIAVNWLITLFWVVGITNAFNFIDSMDGLAVGVSGIAVAFLILVTLGSPQTSLLQLLTLMIGTCVGLFFFNMPPARFFLGDSGAQTLDSCLLLSVFYIRQCNTLRLLLGFCLSSFLECQFSIPAWWYFHAGGGDCPFIGQAAITPTTGSPPSGWIQPVRWQLCI